MKSKYCQNFNLTKEQFYLQYPNFSSSKINEKERDTLFEFCNCVRVLQCLIPPHNNKEHILDLATRLTEGYSVRRVTGTGMTEETARRYEIIHVEGGVKIRPRTVPETKNKPSDTSSSSSATTSTEENDSNSSSSENNKRSRNESFCSLKKPKNDDEAEESGLLLLCQAYEALKESA